MQELFEIKNVEIFSVGDWNGKKITEADLTELADTYAKTSGFVSPYLKLGHNEAQPILQSAGLPAAGWVANVRKAGKKLVADFVDIPKEIFKLIKSKAYKKCSIEIFKSVDIDGVKYPKLLGAVALLGAETPAVLNLKDILANYTLSDKFKAAHTFSTDSETDIIESSEIEIPEKFAMEIQEKLDAATLENKKLQEQIDAQKAEADALKEKFSKLEAEKAEAEKLVAKAKAEQAEAEAEKFVTELQAEKLCTKAMAGLLKAAIGPEVEKYSIDSKEMSKQELVKEILKQAHEAAKVNFSSTTSGEKTGGELTADKVEKYAKDKGITFREAYSQLCKNQ